MKNSSENIERNILLNAENWTPVFDDPIWPLWVIFDQTRDVMSKARELELNTYHLTRAQATLLFILLSANVGLTISEIANCYLRELHSVLTLVNRMAKVGLVKKLHDKETGKIIVVITESGKKTYLNANRRSIEMIFSCINEEEKTQLLSILKKLRARGRELLGVGFKPPFLP